MTQHGICKDTDAINNIKLRKRNTSQHETNTLLKQRKKEKKFVVLHEFYFSLISEDTFFYTGQCQFRFTSISEQIKHTHTHTPENKKEISSSLLLGCVLLFFV